MTSLKAQRQRLRDMLLNRHQELIRGLPDLTYRPLSPLNDNLWIVRVLSKQDVLCVYLHWTKTDIANLPVSPHVLFDDYSWSISRYETTVLDPRLTRLGLPIDADSFATASSEVGTPFAWRLVRQHLETKISTKLTAQNLELEAARKEVQSLKRARDSAEGELQGLRKSQRVLKTDISALEERVQKSDDEHTNLQKTIEFLTHQLCSSEDQASEIRRDCTTSKSAAEFLREENKDLREQLEAFKESAHHHEQGHEASRSEVMSLGNELSRVQQELKAYQTQADISSSEIRRLREDVLVLAAEKAGVVSALKSTNKDS